MRDASSPGADRRAGRHAEAATRTAEYTRNGPDPEAGTRKKAPESRKTTYCTTERGVGTTRVTWMRSRSMRLTTFGATSSFQKSLS